MTDCEMVYRLLDKIEARDARTADALRDEVLSIYDPDTDTLDADCLPLVVRRLCHTLARLNEQATAPERIRAWVKREFAPRRVEQVFADLLDVATGNRSGNRFERAALARIFPETNPGQLKAARR